MRFTEKAWVKVTIAITTPVILGLAFVYGQIYFLNRQSAASFTPISANSIASAKLADLADGGLILVFKEKRFI